MVGFLEAGRQAFESYKKDIIAALLFGLMNIAVSIPNIIPILGAIITAYLFPRVLGWYYNKTIGNINPNYNLAFKIWLIYLLATHFIILLTFGTIIFGLLPKASSIILGNTEAVFSILSKMVYGAILAFIALFVIALIFYYPLYASILGKINEIKIDIEKSAILFLYVVGWGVILSILVGIIGLIPFIGPIINILFSLFFFVHFSSLVIAHKVLSM